MLKTFLKNKKGNAIIWVTGIALIVAPIVANFANRLMFNANLQSATVERKNKEVELENFADYLQSLPESQLEQIADAGSFSNEINGVTGRLAMEAQSVEGVLDHGQESPVYSISELVKIEWNRCDLNKEGVLMVNEAVQTNVNQNCGTGTGFRENLFFTPAGSLALSSMTGILHYRITTESGQPIQDGNWHLDLSVAVTYGAPGDTLEIQKVFTLTP